MVPREVDFRTLLQPAQVAWEVMSTVLNGKCQQNFHTSRGLDLRYLPIRLSISIARDVGRDMRRQASLTAY